MKQKQRYQLHGYHRADLGLCFCKFETRLFTFEERAELPDIETAGPRELTQGQLQEEERETTQYQEKHKWYQECTWNNIKIS